jgi:hypothetical protein
MFFWLQIRTEPRWGGGVTTVLELFYSCGDGRTRSVMLSRAPSPCLSLREKLSVVQHVNLCLSRLQDGGEAGTGGHMPLAGTGQLSL